MKILKNIKAQAGMLSFFIGAMVAVIIALQVAWPVIDTSIYGGVGTATGTVDYGTTVNVGTTLNISTETYTFTNGTAGAFKINLQDGGVYNGNASNATTGLVAEITANSTKVSAVGVITTNTTTITSIVSGTAGNYAMTTNTTGATLSGAKLTGGTDSATHNMSTASSTLVDQIPLFLVLVLFMVFVKAVI